jgi:hypothetical protein
MAVAGAVAASGRARIGWTAVNLTFAAARLAPKLGPSCPDVAGGRSAAHPRLGAGRAQASTGGLREAGSLAARRFAGRLRRRRRRRRLGGLGGALARRVGLDARRAGLQLDPWLAPYAEALLPALPATGPALRELIERVGLVAAQERVATLQH